MIADSYYDNKKEMIELIKHAVRIGYTSAKVGKDIKLFEEPEINYIGKEDKKKTLDELYKKFN